MLHDYGFYKFAKFENILDQKHSQDLKRMMIEVFFWFENWGIRRFDEYLWWITPTHDEWQQLRSLQE